MNYNNLTLNSALSSFSKRGVTVKGLIERRREGKDVVEKSVQAIWITAPWRGL